MKLKSVQRCFRNIILSKYQYLAVFILVIVILCFSHLGEVLNNLTNDNEFSYCGEPIDVVYTWVNGSDAQFRDALNSYIAKGSHIIKDYSDERYDDKYELKFSLRSLEKYAPWVRHVYIVTNGQIPYWLNLDYEKITIVTHDEIFPDTSALPTFSSPAIESNLHRIPGLSKNFVYFNDDIFLGAPTFPDDFQTNNRGFLIYLAWPLPSCVPNCPWAYVGDGQCDGACFNIECQFDGGDCTTDFSILNVNSRQIDELHDNSNEFDYEINENAHKLAPISEQHKKPTITNHTTSKLIKPDQLKIKTIVLNNNSHIPTLINEHNLKILLNDKLKRKKRLYKSTKRKEFYKSILNSSDHNGYQINNNHSKEKELDTYALSLQHTNRMFNSVYGFKARKVPAHSPILIDKLIMEKLHEKFEKQFVETRKNKIRSGNDVQFSFAYYYYLIHEKKSISVGDIFDEFDTDSSSTWSDREIRTILTRINDLPLSYGMVELFDTAILNCSKTIEVPEVTTPPYERYIDSKLPVVSKQLVVNCPFLIDVLRENFGQVAAYKHEIIKNAQSQHVLFKMLTSNISEVVGHLDEIRKHPRKFVCLNDNMNPIKHEENDLVKSILLDFYISLFPKPSKFELPQEYRNRFSYVTDLNDWKQYHVKLKFVLLFCVIILCTISFYNICKRKFARQIKRMIYF